MNTLPDIALVFAHECLGWDDAEIPQGAVSVFSRHGSPRLQYEKLDSIEAAVRKWALSHDDIGFYVYFTRRGHYILAIQRQDIIPHQVIYETAECEDLKEALIKACLGAQRKLRGATCT